MYREERGTWFNARYQLDAPASYNLEYDREEPEWNILPPPNAYADELRMFPRSEENVPEWLMGRLAGLGPDRPGPRFRMARIFDGTNQAGRPVITRPEVDVDEQDRLLSYLGAAPVVLPGRGFDIDRLSPSPEPRVPVAFHSDGNWIWPAAVNFYLQEYGVAPEPELVEHIRQHSYQVPEVSEEKRAAAGEYLTKTETAPQPAAPAAPRMPWEAPETSQLRPEPSAITEEPEPTQAWRPFRLPESPAMTDPLMPAQQFEAEDNGDIAEDDPDRALQAEISTAYFDVRADTAVDDHDVEDSAEHDTDERLPINEPVVKRLHAKLTELDVPAASYRIGAPTQHGWSLEEVPEGWRVGWYDVALSNPSVFGDADDAAAFMLGKLLLEPGGSASGRHEAMGSGADSTDDFSAVDSRFSSDTDFSTPHNVADALTPPAPAPEPAEPQRYEPPPPPPAPRQEVPPVQPTVLQPAVTRPPSSGAPSAPGAWPIQPLPGEPPLTLFRGKQLEDLPLGSELDRFGGPDGNLTYVAGTPYEERSLVPEWVHRPYHVYRVQRPIEVLSGVAIPWFNQPGGGSAYVLPASIEELLADGVLIELDPGEPPID
ncbi:MAG: DUF4237 domain-containing protein [Actinophytocola sp.]|nr:DUF4237 domain-containing protein [Actinophytocola sp.]